MTPATTAAAPATISGVSSPAAASAGDSPAWLVVWALCRRELVRFFRQRNRVIGALGQPLIFWVLFGFGLQPSFRVPAQAGAEGMGSLEYLFPGTAVLIVLFTAIFTTISVIEDRREGLLQSVLVAPIPRWGMVLGKLLGGTLISLFQVLVFLLLGLTLNLSVSPVGFVSMVGLLFTLGLGLCGLGFVLAWRTDSVQGFHAVMSLLLMPMWLLSGAFFPDSGGWLGWVIRLNPLTYGVAGLRRLLYSADVSPALPANLPELSTCWAVTLVFALLMFAAATWSARGRTTGDLL